MQIRALLVGLCLVVVLLVPAQPAQAATTTWSGTLGTDIVPSWGDVSGTACLTTGTVPRTYHVQAFYVDTATTYDLVITTAAGMRHDPDATMMVVYTPSFDPANWVQNCIYQAASDTGPSSIIGLALRANTQYYVVVMNAWFGSASGATFSGEIRSATGTAYLGTLPNEWNPRDGRLNPEPAAPLAIYCGADSIYAYLPGLLEFDFPRDEAGETPAQHTLLATGVTGARLYRLSTGEFQVNMVHGSEEYVFTWDACPATITTTRVYDALTRALISEFTRRP